MITICSCCGSDSRVAHIEKAHVKDKSVMIKLGIKNHTYLNIIDLCASCHTLFDNFGGKCRMGLRLINDNMYFIKLNEVNQIERIPAKKTINVLAEYISWKNERVDLRLYKILNT